MQLLSVFLSAFQLTESYIITSAEGWRLCFHLCLFVCLSVCPLDYSKNYF